MTCPPPPSIPTAGIYAIRNHETGEIFVGSNLNVDKAIRTLIVALQRERPNTSSLALNNAARVYGPSAFEGLVLQRTSNANELQQLRSDWIRRLDTIQQGYNVRESSAPKANTEQRLDALERDLAEALKQLQELKLR